MIRKMILVFGSAAVGALVAFSWRDILRYAKMVEISLGKGHPEAVPAEGITAYPQDPSHAAQDGTGEFDSARRGGPAQAGQAG